MPSDAPSTQTIQENVDDNRTITSTRDVLNQEEAKQDLGKMSATTTTTTTNNNGIFRTVVGESMDNFTQFVNDNLIMARFGVMATVTLLAAYGIANTPLFFRFRTVAEIPCELYIYV